MRHTSSAYEIESLKLILRVRAVISLFAFPAAVQAAGETRCLRRTTAVRIRCICLAFLIHVNYKSCAGKLDKRGGCIPGLRRSRLRVARCGSSRAFSRQGRLHGSELPRDPKCSGSVQVRGDVLPVASAHLPATCEYKLELVVLYYYKDQFKHMNAAQSARTLELRWCVPHLKQRLSTRTFGLLL